MMMTHKRYGYNCVESIWFDARGCADEKKDGLGFNKEARVDWPCTRSAPCAEFKENEHFASSTNKWELSVIQVNRDNGIE